MITNANKLLLAIFNSKLGWYQIQTYCTKIQNGYQLIYKYLEKIWIKKIDLSNTAEKALDNEIVRLVDSILTLNQQKETTALPEKIEQLNQRIAYTDEKINKLVYELYGLGEEEIGIVEGNG